jgi:hypothetical protein
MQRADDISAAFRRAKNLCVRNNNDGSNQQTTIKPTPVLPTPVGKYAALTACHAEVVSRKSPQASETPKVLPVRPTEKENVKREPKSCAQVRTSVEQQAVQQKSGGLKPNDGKATHIGIRLSLQERQQVLERAVNSGLKISSYARAALLGADYVAKHDPVRRRRLQDLSTELGRQGNNLNQIARQLNSGLILPDEAFALLNDLGNSLISAHNAVRITLIEGQVMP